MRPPSAIRGLGRVVGIETALGAPPLRPRYTAQSGRRVWRLRTFGLPLGSEMRTHGRSRESQASEQAHSRAKVRQAEEYVRERRGGRTPSLTVENLHIIASAFDGIDANDRCAAFDRIHRSLLLALSRKSFVQFYRVAVPTCFQNRESRLTRRRTAPASKSMGYRNSDHLGPE